MAGWPPTTLNPPLRSSKAQDAVLLTLRRRTVVSFRSIAKPVVLLVVSLINILTICLVSSRRHRKRKHVTKCTFIILALSVTDVLFALVPNDPVFCLSAHATACTGHSSLGHVGDTGHWIISDNARHICSYIHQVWRSRRTHNCVEEGEEFYDH